MAVVSIARQGVEGGGPLTTYFSLLTTHYSLRTTHYAPKVCWEADPKKRPPFGRILDSLRAIGRTMERTSSGASSSTGEPVE